MRRRTIGLLALDDCLDPEIEIDLSRNVTKPGVYRGHAGFERMVRATR